jgi:galactokinase
MSRFEERFGRPPEVSARAPGRVNVIGEHTDYNGGSVLPTPIPQHARVELAARPGRSARVASASRPEPEGFVSFTLGEEERRGTWIDYVQGAARILASAGHPVHGFDAQISSDVPIGSGLSSSAALTVALLRALRSRFALPLDDVALALLAQKVETEFVGARVGIMDPMSSSLGREGTALLLRTRDLTFRYIPIPEEVELIVLDSGQSHRHASGEYNRRRAECEQAATLLGVERLCDLPREAWERIAGLPPPLDRRARHVVTENDRVRLAVRALEKARLGDLGSLLDESHRSLRDDFEVSTPEIDALVLALRGEEGVCGARLTGGGFGGSVIALARQGVGDMAARRAAQEYSRRTGCQAGVVVPSGSRSAAPLHS